MGKVQNSEKTNTHELFINLIQKLNTACRLELSNNTAFNKVKKQISKSFSFENLITMKVPWGNRGGGPAGRDDGNGGTGISSNFCLSILLTDVTSSVVSIDSESFPYKKR